MKCLTDQKIHFYGQEFVDDHITPQKRCIGNPCEIHRHAEIKLIAHIARHGMGLKNQVIRLHRMPCDVCAKLFISMGVEKLEIDVFPKTPEENRVFELLAVHIAMYFPPEKKDAQDSRENADRRSVQRRPKSSKASSKS